MLVIFADESLWMPLIYPVRCVHFPVPYHRDSMSPRACSEFRLRPSCHRETPLPDLWRPRIRSLPETKWERRVLPRNRRNSTELDETRRIESRCRFIWVIWNLSRRESRWVESRPRLPRCHLQASRRGAQAQRTLPPLYISPSSW